MCLRRRKREWDKEIEFSVMRSISVIFGFVRKTLMAAPFFVALFLKGIYGFLQMLLGEHQFVSDSRK